jgi:deazaflavin-dependent oxidoreductase (nitroreductase family)
MINRAINAWGRRTKAWTKPMNVAAKEFGVRPFTSLTDIFRGDYTLVTDIPQLTGVPDLPANWRYVGPIYAKLEGEAPPEIADLPRDRPIIYFAMGSSANQDVLVRVMRMFAGQPYTVIAPIKRHLAGLDVTVPDNVHVFDWLPAHKVNPLADVAVLHGGQGTVQTACASGTPFLGIGLQPEQDINVLQAAQFGSALHLNRYALNEERVLTAVHRLLTEPSFRQKAAELRDELINWPGAANVAAFLHEKFLATPTPEEDGMSKEFQQKDAGFLTYPTGGWRLAVFKWPVQLWRLGLGPLLGQLFVLITTTGRKSGLPRRTLTEFHRMNGRIYAPSGFGRRAQWYRNIEADPRVTIQTAVGAQSVVAVRVTDDQEILGLLRVMEKKDGKMMREIYLNALDIAYDDADILAKKDRIYWLRFDPTDEPTPPPLQADLLWVWPMLAVTGLIKLALWRAWRTRQAGRENSK